MAFRKKADIILLHSPDVLVVPECEHPDKLKFGVDTQKPSSVLWFGANRHKGLGIFSYGDYKLKLIRDHNEELKTIVPITITNKKKTFTLLAVWANNPGDPDGTYITQVWKAIHYYEKLLKSKRTLLAGDFNSNTIWDKPRREGNHSTVVAQLEAKNIHSVYHRFFKQEQGKEKHPTLFMYRHIKKPYHLDYCFASADLANAISNVTIGKHKDWCSYSDHTPLMVTFDV